MRALRQGGHRGPAHGLVLLPVFALAVGVTIVGLGALPALGQVVAVLAAEEVPEDGDPQGFRALSPSFSSPPCLSRGVVVRVVPQRGVAVIVSVLDGGRGRVGSVVVCRRRSRGRCHECGGAACPLLGRLRSGQLRKDGNRAIKALL